MTCIDKVVNFKDCSRQLLKFKIVQTMALSNKITSKLRIKVVIKALEWLSINSGKYYLPCRFFWGGGWYGELNPTPSISPGKQFGFKLSSKNFRLRVLLKWPCEKFLRGERRSVATCIWSPLRGVHMYVIVPTLNFKTSCLLRRMPSHCRHFTILYLRLFSSLSHFQPILVSRFSPFSSQSFLSHCFKVMSLVRILPLQGLCIS